MVELTREEYNLTAERSVIKKPQNMPTKTLLNTLNYDSNCKGEKLSKIRPGKVAKIQNVSNNELNQAEKLQRKSIDEVKEIARFRRIKDRGKLTK